MMNFVNLRFFVSYINFIGATCSYIISEANQRVASAMAAFVESSDHVLLVPFMAQGHFIPFLELADLLIRRTSCAVTVVSTALNASKLRSAIQTDDSSIRFAELPYSSSDHGLPPDAESTDTVPPQLHPAFFISLESLQAPFERLIEKVVKEEDGRRILVIGDYFLGWTLESARKMRVPHAAFATSGALGTAVLLGLWRHLPDLDMKSGSIKLPGFPESFELHPSQLSASVRQYSPTDPISIFFRRQLSLSLQSDALLCNSAEEMEKTGAEILNSVAPLPVWCVGPLFRRGSGAKDIVFDDGKVKEWLDTRPNCTVVYASFGSQNSLWPSQMKELAVALEASGQPFVWAIRPPKGRSAESPASEWLPEGYEERVAGSGQGMLLKGWAPQLEILSHPSTAAFLSHCGWNSVVESLSQGVPIMGWPLAAEQAVNSMAVEQMGAGVEVLRGMGDEADVGTVKEKVESAIRMMVGGGEKGSEMRKMAGKIGRVINSCVADGGSQQRIICELMNNFFRRKSP